MLFHDKVQLFSVYDPAILNGLNVSYINLQLQNKPLNKEYPSKTNLHIHEMQFYLGHDDEQVRQHKGDCVS